MTLLSTDRSTDFTSTVGGETVLTFDFRIFRAEDLDVYKNETLLTLNVDYTVLIDSDDGTITLAVALEAQDRVQIFRCVDPLQSLDLVPAGPFPADSVENQFDKATAQIQDVDGKAGKAVRVSPTSDLNGIEIPDPFPNAVLGTTQDNEVAWIDNSSTPAPAGSTFEVEVATAGQSVFTLVNAYNPGTNQIHVYINGVRQNPGAYTETSTTSITFSEGLEAGDEVLVVRSAFQNLVGADASAITFTQSGAGAIPTTVAAKLFELPTVVDYGAQGDGITDDSTAFITALANHTVVYVPTGTYLLSSPITVLETQTLVAAPLATLNATGGITFAGEFLGSDTAHFPVTAVVSFTQADVVLRPEWFGALPSVSLAARESAIARLIASLTQGGRFTFATRFQTVGATVKDDEVVLTLGFEDMLEVTTKVIGREDATSARAWFGKRLFASAEAAGPIAAIDAQQDIHPDVELPAIGFNAVWTVTGADAIARLAVNGIGGTTVDWRVAIDVQKHRM